MKSDCWNKHRVKFKIVDNLSEKTIIDNIHLDNDKLWVRKEFVCKAAQGLVPKVTYSPYVWESEKDTEFATKRVWFLPVNINKDIEAWNVPICFPSDFATVPILPTVNRECDCNNTKALVTPLPKPKPRPEKIKKSKRKGK
tara:strand:- start:313 stop:735 length:423 start_codon:yes stop_codon:yes gene_type:complete